ncbi:zinc-ribbon domain-containing protein [Phaeobacter gallaeciensis]|uniref:Zinc-ribbon domain protein n=1 Tax=Phaeobacter gallaeciensis TaxID=60890 RepID=A0AAD0EE43_9RHOB|nr:zinc-ribbon domain-containing protein [Phaeobacter gallaeciensis]AHD10881.1 zinc-ribbon domain protein [Phaeobacter gallaeciensis DSM 26640]ATE94144.1 zinc-ribbon domain protein [Phaeobacter gallaeciensis]ATE96035.1 zinc-ribbon domain protein [Phaeobacter gallaeciensis]ATF02808.1 zinc-ribbon domain protein [Phaeobacter gallaeciensis]ATF07188.1 zinc-ribbon domain protein [Phaeobacter gallaeciensis]
MRLTCPNCAAQYEVPDDVIPDEGRDVQCSNCGQTWFQAGRALDADDAESAPTAGPNLADLPPDADTPASHISDQDPLTDDADDDIAEETDLPPDEAVSEDHPAEEDTAEDRPPDVAATARGLDPAISDILREEAEREASLRAAENSPLQTQTDLGLDSLPEEESARRAREAREQMARMRGEDPQQLATAETESRRGLLPNIDEINSTLRSGEGAAAPITPPMDAAPPKKKRNFARGFAFALLIALALAMAYDNAPLIAQKLPQADPYLSTYVAKVDAARLWLDTQVRAFTVQQ